MEKSAEILSVIPLGLFYNGFSVEDDRLTVVLCELIGKLLHPFTYDQIVSDENKVKLRKIFFPNINLFIKTNLSSS
jgi:26S proteasome non-ATPase regulatory subunit 5